MNESSQDLQKPTDSESAAILWIAWEMTKQTTDANKVPKLQKEFAANLDAVLSIWQNRWSTDNKEIVLSNDSLENSVQDAALQPKKSKKRLFSKK